MDDQNNEEPLIECPSCHHAVPKKSMTMVSGRQLCLSCAGAWFDDDDDDE